MLTVFALHVREHTDQHAESLPAFIRSTATLLHRHQASRQGDNYDTMFMHIIFMLCVSCLRGPAANRLLAPSTSGAILEHMIVTLRFLERLDLCGAKGFSFWVCVVLCVEASTLMQTHVCCICTNKRYINDMYIY